MDKVFADGFYWDRHENAPDFVVGKMSVKVAQAVPFLQEHANDGGYVNLQVKRSKGGKLYVELDTWQPEQRQPSQPPAESQPPAGDDIPF